jgi:type IV fimbrial biogenesis protein FimT
MLAMRRVACGVALVELMVVLAIAALLIGLASPDMSEMIRRHRLDTAVGDLFGAFDLTRSQAIARGDRVQLVPLEPGGTDWNSGWIVFIDANGDRRPGPGEEVIASHGPVADGIVISAKFTSNTPPYYFAYCGAGRGCSDAGSMTARWGTVSLRQDAQIRRIRINMLGRARICNPKRDPDTCGGPE